MLLIGFAVVAATYLSVVVRGQDDIAGGMALCVFTMFGSIVVATAAAVFERLLRNAAEIKSENDLTV